MNGLCGLYESCDDDGDPVIRGTYTIEGIIKLCEGLKGSAVTSMKCAAPRPERLFAFVSAPIDTPPSCGSLADNQLCGVNRSGQGTYTTEGITQLCEGLNETQITKLLCAAAIECSLLRQRPLTHALSLTASLSISTR